MEEGVEVDELSYYSKEKKIIYNKVKSSMSFLSHKQIVFLLDCYDLIPLFISLAALFFIVRFMFSQQFVEFHDMLHRNSLVANYGWGRSNEGKLFVGYCPVVYERDIRLRGSSPSKEIVTGCTVSEGVERARLVYIKGIYPSKAEALKFLNTPSISIFSSKPSTGSQVTIFIEDGEPVYRVREEMLEIGVFRISNSYNPWHDADLVEILGHEAFQRGEVESYSYR